MVAVTPTISQSTSIIYSGASRIYGYVFEAEDVDTGNTITFPGLTTVKDAIVLKKADQATCTFTISTTTTNMITVTETLSAVDLVGSVMGV